MDVTASNSGLITLMLICDIGMHMTAFLKNIHLYQTARTLTMMPNKPWLANYPDGVPKTINPD
ncbi:MAG: hypothetical protein ABGX70_05455, partial [Psychrobacter sp.]